MEIAEILSAQVVQVGEPLAQKARAAGEADASEQEQEEEARLTAEITAALDSGRHVFVPGLSGVSADAERALKTHALGVGRLVLGPGADIAVLPNGRFGHRHCTGKGPVGIFGTAAGGIREVMSLVWDHYETGVSCAIDVGCRDLTPRVGGLMTEAVAGILSADPETRCLCLAAHEPAEEIRAHLHEVLKCAGKPVVVRYLGTSAEASGLRDGVFYASDLDEAAQASALLAAGKPLEFRKQCAKCEVCFKAVKLREGKALPRRLAAFFSSGDLALETAAFLRASGMKLTMPVVPASPGLLHVVPGNFAADMGLNAAAAADLDSKCAMLSAAAADASVGLLMFDILLGEGAHPDPGSVFLSAVQKGLSERSGGDIVVMASISGTKDDPQGFARTKALLKDAGIVVAPTAAKAARIASELW